MTEACEKWLDNVNRCVYYTHQTRWIYQVLLYSLDFKASWDIWNQWERQYLVKIDLFGIKDL